VARDWRVSVTLHYRHSYFLCRLISYDIPKNVECGHLICFCYYYHYYYRDCLTTD